MTSTAARQRAMIAGPLTSRRRRRPRVYRAGRSAAAGPGAAVPAPDGAGEDLERLLAPREQHHPLVGAVVGQRPVRPPRRGGGRAEPAPVAAGPGPGAVQERLAAAAVTAEQHHLVAGRIV